MNFKEWKQVLETQLVLSEGKDRANYNAEIMFETGHLVNSEMDFNPSTFEELKTLNLV